MIFAICLKIAVVKRVDGFSLECYLLYIIVTLRKPKLWDTSIDIFVIAVLRIGCD